MSSLALTGKSRRLITKIHRWTGLAMLLFLLVAGITGSILSFRWELDRLINPDLFIVDAQAQPLPYARLIQSAEDRFQDAIVSNVILPKRPEDALIVYLKSKMDAHVAHVHVPGMANTLAFNQAFINPYTAEILGQRNTAKFVLAWENFIPVMMRLHYSLFLKEWGAWFMGVCAIFWFLTSFVGLALAWPKRYRQWSGWRPGLSVRRGSGGYKLNYDLHRAASLITFPVLIVVAFTSIYVNLPNVVKPVVNMFSPLSSASSIPKARKMDADTRAASIEQAIATATEALPGARPHSVSRDFIKGLYNVRLQLPGDVAPSGNNNAFVRMDNGQLFMLKEVTGRSAGDVFISWLRPLHSGLAFGLTGQILILISALALVAMCITAFNVWLRKHRAEQRQALRQKPSLCGGVQAFQDPH